MPLRVIVNRIAFYKNAWSIEMSSINPFLGNNVNKNLQDVKLNLNLQVNQEKKGNNDFGIKSLAQLNGDTVNFTLKSNEQVKKGDKLDAKQSTQVQSDDESASEDLEKNSLFAWLGKFIGEKIDGAKGFLIGTIVGSVIDVTISILFPPIGKITNFLGRLLNRFVKY
jgi:hypothetical protein